MKRKSASYSQDFINNCLEMVATSDKPIKQIASDLGIPQATLYAWNRKRKNQAEMPGKKRIGANSSEEQKKIKELQKRVKELEMEKEILKKAMGFFMPRQK